MSELQFRWGASASSLGCFWFALSETKKSQSMSSCDRAGDRKGNQEDLSEDSKKAWQVLGLSCHLGSALSSWRLSTDEPCIFAFSLSLFFPRTYLWQERAKLLRLTLAKIEEQHVEEG